MFPGNILRVLLARTVVDPLDLRRNAVLCRRLQDQRRGGGVEDAHRVVVVAADAHDVLVVVAKRQRADTPAEEVVADGVDGSFALRGRKVGGPYVHHGRFAHLPRRRVGPICTDCDAGNVITVGVEEQLLVFGQIVHHSQARGGIHNRGRIDKIRIVPVQCVRASGGSGAVSKG